MGRTLDNALLNLNLKRQYSDGIEKLGFNLEDLLEKERDAALGNGGLGRLAACYLDSSASQELPVWGYGLRYQYGIFQQLIGPDGSQLEAPDPWLQHDNPWELARGDVTYEIRFYGHSERIDGMKAIWSGGQEVLAVAYDVMIPGYDTKNTNNLRLWESKPKRGFDLNSFNGAFVVFWALVRRGDLTYVADFQLVITSVRSSLPIVPLPSRPCCIPTTTPPVRRVLSFQILYL